MKIFDQTPREGLTCAQWVAREAVRAQKRADDLWIDMDEWQLANDTDVMSREYEAICDWLDLLELLPECAFNGHPVSQDYDQQGRCWISCAYPGCGRRSLPS